MTDDNYVTIQGERWTVWHLANLAGCASPSSTASPGALMLKHVAEATSEVIDDYRQDSTPEDRYDYSGELHEIADAAPDVYTAGLWAEFCDLAAWNEDPSDLTTNRADMQARASVCLYLIAERLARALVEEFDPYDS